MLVTELLPPEDSGREHKTFSISSVASLLLAGLLLAVWAALRGGPQRTTQLAIAATLLLGFILALHGWFLVHLRSAQRRLLSHLRRVEHDNFLAGKELAANRILVESTSAEADTLRNSTTTLTQDPPLDSFLDFVLRDLASVVPLQAAQILVKDDDNQLISICESSPRPNASRSVQYPTSLDLGRLPLLKRILKAQAAEILSQTQLGEARTGSWLPDGLGSCLVAPLTVGSETIGMLWAGSNEGGAFSPRHLRAIVSIANSASVAIQNARLRERAEILGLELSDRVSELRVQRAETSSKGGYFSGEDFRAIFQASPVAMSITTLREERFVDCNRAFLARYGYSRSELIGRTAKEIHFWESQNHPAIFSSELRQGPVRNLMLTQRAKSGELRISCVSADRIRLEDEEFVLAISGEIPVGPLSVN